MEDLVRLPSGVAGTLSPLILRTPFVAELLGVNAVVPLVPGRRVDAVLGWGRKPASRAAMRWARFRGVPFFHLEDGFLRSVGVGREGALSCSAVVDDLGIYYDCTRPSRLESLLQQPTPELADAVTLAQAERLREKIVHHRLSKYNRVQREPLEAWPDGGALVVDQVRGDLSLQLGGARRDVIRRMLQAALDENPTRVVWLKDHPDPRASAVRNAVGQLPDRVRSVPAHVNTMRLLESMERVYVLTSLVGFEALLLGKRVSVFGSPFYAGWGLTDDRAPTLSTRTRRRSLNELFAATHILYTRYYDPLSGKRVSPEGAVEWLLAQLAESTPRSA